MLNEDSVLDLGEHVVDLKSGLGGDSKAMWSATKQETALKEQGTEEWRLTGLLREARVLAMSDNGAARGTRASALVAALKALEGVPSAGSMVGGVYVLHHDPAEGLVALAHVTPHTAVRDAVGRDASFECLGRRVGTLLGDFSSVFRAGSPSARPFAALYRSASSQPSAWAGARYFEAAVEACLAEGDTAARSAAARFLGECREQRSAPCLGGLTTRHIAAVGPGRRQDDESWSPGSGAGGAAMAGGAPDPWAMEEGPVDTKAKATLMQALGLPDTAPAPGTGDSSGGAGEEEAAPPSDDGEDDGSDVRVTIAPQAGMGPPLLDAGTLAAHLVSAALAAAARAAALEAADAETATGVGTTGGGAGRDKHIPRAGPSHQMGGVSVYQGGYARFIQGEKAGRARSNARTWARCARECVATAMRAHLGACGNSRSSSSSSSGSASSSSTGVTSAYGSVAEEEEARTVFVLRAVGAELLRIAAAAGGGLAPADGSAGVVNGDDAGAIRLLAGDAADEVAVVLRESGRVLLRDAGALARVALAQGVTRAGSVEAAASGAGGSSEGSLRRAPGAAVGLVVELVVGRASGIVERGVKSRSESKAKGGAAAGYSSPAAGNVVVVGKLPLPGRCKTRLAAALRKGGSGAGSAAGESTGGEGPDPADRAAAAVARACLLATCAGVTSEPGYAGRVQLLCALPRGTGAGEGEEGVDSSMDPGAAAAGARSVLAGAEGDKTGSADAPDEAVQALAGLAADLEMKAPGVTIAVVRGGRDLSDVLSGAVLRSQLSGSGGDAAGRAQGGGVTGCFGEAGEVLEAEAAEVFAASAAGMSGSIEGSGSTLGGEGGAFGPTLLLGADCPMVPAADIMAAMDRCARTGEAVMLPASDGGYVALALPWFAPPVAAFRGVRWSVPSTAASQLAALDSAGVRAVASSKCWSDVDGADGVRELAGWAKEAADAGARAHAEEASYAADACVRMIPAQ